MMFIKNIDGAETPWQVYHSALGADNKLELNSNAASSSGNSFDNASDVGTAPTATEFTVKALNVTTNHASYHYIAFLFATLAGVSKVGSYTGTGSSQNIDCGFTNGARFVMIKRTDSAASWNVFDTKQGIVAGNDPHIYWDSQTTQDTSDDKIDPYSAGFTVVGSHGHVNASSGSYIFLAFA